MLRESPCFGCKRSLFCEPEHHECRARCAWVEELYAEYKKLDTDQRNAEWEMFDLITSAYYGKRYYFPENNGLVYSRDSHIYMSREEAYNEFLERITRCE